MTRCHLNASLPKFLAGVAVGATGMYYFDPVKGRGRRAGLRDHRHAASRVAKRKAEQQARDAANRAQGKQARGRGAGRFHPTDGRSVELHLHEVLAGLDVNTADVTVEAYEGLVRVRGQVSSDADRDRVVDVISEQPGVRSVESLLHLPGQPAPNKQPVRQVDDRSSAADVGR